jgi:hypothetical protein
MEKILLILLKTKEKLTVFDIVSGILCENCRKWSRPYLSRLTRLDPFKRSLETLRKNGLVQTTQNMSFEAKTGRDPYYVLTNEGIDLAKQIRSEKKKLIDEWGHLI